MIEKKTWVDYVFDTFNHLLMAALAFGTEEEKERLATRFIGCLDTYLDGIEEVIQSEFKNRRLRSACTETDLSKTVKELNFRVKYNLAVLATKKDGEVKPVISGDRRFEKGEHLLVLGKEEDVHKVTK